MPELMSLEPVVLRGRLVRLEPLTPDHIPLLTDVGVSPELWQWTTNRITSASEMAEYVETALRWQREGTALPFATIAQETGQVIGTSRFANIDRANRRLEIGWTWVTPT